MQSLKRKQRKHFDLSQDEKDILIIALETLKTETNRFSDKCQEFGEFTITLWQIEMLQEYLRYG